MWSERFRLISKGKSLPPIDAKPNKFTGIIQCLSHIVTASRPLLSSQNEIVAKSETDDPFALLSLFGGCDTLVVELQWHN